MKNILILNDKYHSNIGGTETYTKNLIKILTNNDYKVFEINFLPNKNIEENIKNYKNIIHKISLIKNKKNIFYLFFNFVWNALKFNKLINKIIKNEKIDIVIDNTINTISYIRKKNINYIWVAHFDVVKLYNEQKSLTSIIKKIFFLRPNKFKFNKVVVFTEKDKEWLLKNNKKIKARNILTCPLSHKSLEEMTNLDIKEKLINAKNIVWIGRLNQKQKNIEFITKISKKLNDIYIYIYGDGPDKNIIINKPGIKYEGPVAKEEINQILRNAKLLILPSFFEGFPYVIVEALSNGIPCLVADTFINAKFLIDNSRGRCIENFDVNVWVKEILFFKNLSNEKYFQYSTNCINFAKTYLTTDQFENFWKKIIE